MVISIRLTLALATTLLVSATTAEAAMSDQTILGTSNDPRITRCGITVTKGQAILVRPFIDASSDLDGSFRVDLDRISASGHSRIVQSNAFAGGVLGNVMLQVNAGSRIALVMSVMAQDGSALCTLDTQLDFSGDAASV